MPDIDISKGVDITCFHFAVEANDETQKELDSRHLYGEMQGQKQILRVTTRHGQERLADSFLHEVIEAIDTELCDSKLAHKDIKILARVLAQVFKSLGVNFVVKPFSLLPTPASPTSPAQPGDTPPHTPPAASHEYPTRKPRQRGTRPGAPQSSASPTGRQASGIGAGGLDQRPQNGH